MDEFITQKELAAHFGLTKGYISQLVKRGVLDGCRKGGKLVRECAIHAIERYRAGAKVRAVSSKPVAITGPAGSEPVVPPPGLDTDENRKQLARLMAEADTPNRKVQLMRDFWAAKLNELKAEETAGELIRMEEAVEAGQKMVRAMRDKLLAIPAKLAPSLVTMTEQEAVEALRREITDALQEVANLGRR